MSKYFCWRVRGVHTWHRKVSRFSSKSLFIIHISWLKSFITVPFPLIRGWFLLIHKVGQYWHKENKREVYVAPPVVRVVGGHDSQWASSDDWQPRLTSQRTSEQPHCVSPLHSGQTGGVIWHTLITLLSTQLNFMCILRAWVHAKKNM